MADSLILLKNSRSPFDTAQGERGLIGNVRNFPFMLSLSKHSKGFFSRIIHLTLKMLSKEL